MAKAAGLPVKSHSKWLTASEKPGLQVRLARISDMTCPRSRCEINVSDLNFIRCEVVEWTNIISFRGGQNFWFAKRLHWKNIGSTSKFSSSMSDFVFFATALESFVLRYSQFPLTLSDLGLWIWVGTNWIWHVHVGALKLMCATWISFDARLWNGTTSSYFVKDGTFDVQSVLHWKNMCH
jgi:hypothetical protein